MSLAASACTSTGSGPVAGNALVSSASLSPAAAALRQQEVEYQRVEEGAITGAVIGGVLGAVAGAALGGSNNRVGGAVVGGLIGSALGGAVGGNYAEGVNQQTRQVSADQNQYRAMISSADRNIANSRKVNASASQLVQAEDARIRRLNGDLSAGRITAANYRSEIASSQENVRLLETASGRMQTDIDVLDRSAGSGNKEASGRAAQLRSEKARLDGQLTRLRSTYSRVPGNV